MVYGGGMTRGHRRQVAFWRQIPVAPAGGVASDDLLLPVPAGGQRRVIGQLASLFLTNGVTAMGTRSARRHSGRRPMAGHPQPSDLRFVKLLRRVRSGGPQLVLVGLDRADSLGVLAGLPDLLDREPNIEIVCYGELAAHGAAYPLQQHDRATVIRSLPLDQLLWLVAASTVLVSTPRAGHRRASDSAPRRCWSTARTSRSRATRPSILSPPWMSTIRQVWRAAGACPGTVARDGGGARRAGRAWLFGALSVTAAQIPLPANSDA